MIDRYLRLPKERLLAPVAKRLDIPPLAVTLTAFGVGLLAVGAAALQLYIWALVLWLAGRVLDGLDGSIARTSAKQSDLGGYLDMLLDTAIYALLPLALAWTQDSSAVWLCLGVLLSSFYLNAISWLYLSAILEKRKQGALSQGEQTSVTMPSGLIEGGETILFYCLFLIFPHALPFLFSFMALLVLVTAAQRVQWALGRL